MKSIFSFFFLFLSFYLPFLGTDKVAQSTIREEIQILADDTISLEKRMISFLEVMFKPTNLESSEIIDYIFPFYQKLIQRQMQHVAGDRYCYREEALLQEIGRKLNIQEWKQSFVNINSMRKKLYEYFPAFIEFLSYEQVKDHVFPLIDQELQHTDFNVETMYLPSRSEESQPAEYPEELQLVEYRIIRPQKQLNLIDAIFKKYKNEIALDDQKKLSSQIFQLIQIHKKEELDRDCCNSSINPSVGSGIYIIDTYFPYLCAEEKRQVFDDLVAFVLEYKVNLFLEQKLSTFVDMIEHIILNNDDKDNLFEIGKQYLKHFEASDNHFEPSSNSFNRQYSVPLYSIFLNILEQSQLSYTKEQLDFLNVLANMPFNKHYDFQLRFIIKFLSRPEINILEKYEFWQKAFDAFDDYPEHRYELMKIMARRVDLNSNEGNALLDKLHDADHITNASKLGIFEGKFSNETLHVERPEIYNKYIDFIKDADHSILERFAALQGFLKNPHLTGISEADFNYFFLFLSDKRFEIYDRCILIKNLLHKYSKQLSAQQLEVLYNLLSLLVLDRQLFMELNNEIHNLLNQKGLSDENLIKSKKSSILFKLCKMWEPWLDIQKNATQLFFDVVPIEFTFKTALEKVIEVIKEQENSQVEACLALKQLDYLSSTFNDYIQPNYLNTHEIFRRVYFRIQNHHDRQKLETKLIKNLALMYNDRIRNNIIQLLKILDGFNADIVFAPNITLEKNLENLFAEEISPAFTFEFAIEDMQIMLCKNFQESCPDFTVIRNITNKNCHDNVISFCKSSSDIDVPESTYALDFTGPGKKRKITSEEHERFDKLLYVFEEIKKIKNNEDCFNNRLFSDIFRRVYLRIKNHDNRKELIENLKNYFDFWRPNFDSDKRDVPLLKTLEGYYPDIRFPYNVKFEQSFKIMFSDVLPDHFTIDYALEDTERMIKSLDGSQGDIDVALQTLDKIKKDTKIYHDQPIQEIFRRVYHRILNNEHKEVLQKILFEELVYNYDNCGSNEETLMRILSGFDPDIIVPIYLKKEFFNAVKTRLLTRIKNFEIEKQEKFFDLLAKSQKDRQADEQLLLEQFLDQELPAIAKELEDEYRNPAKADDPLTENCFKAYLKGACAVFLNLVDHDPYAHMG
ncbi:MAG: hypothetical protein Q8S31_10105 [Alphaproteobacteria bacterium]|nr:hypothetical protein [Alphaproteobacteria bacterium]